MVAAYVRTIVLVLALSALPFVVIADEPVDHIVPISDEAVDQIVQIIENMDADGYVRIHLEEGPGGQSTLFMPEEGGSSESTFVLDQLKRVDFLRGPQASANGTDISIDGSEAAKRFAALLEGSFMYVSEVELKNFISNGAGGVFKVEDEATIDLSNVRLADNFAVTWGGLVAVDDNGKAFISDSRAERNGAGQLGGSISVDGNATAEIDRTVFIDGTAGDFGCDINLVSRGVGAYGSALVLNGNQFSGPCFRASLENPQGDTFVHGSSFYFDDEAVHSTGGHSSFLAYYGVHDHYPMAQPESGGVNKPEALCEDFGTNSFSSLGYNFSEDNSCGLNQETDIRNTEANTLPDENGIFIPQPGSPLIDSGPTEAMVFPGETLESLPCDYKDIRGVGRPQDANNDGIFECDRGATEVQGPGEITPGHSAAFYNLARDGEGQYVELLNENLAVVYTFTHRPDASGSAWFIGVGNVVENAIVIDDLLRPTGTSFGDQFDTAQIVNLPAGGQSMVFNDCDAGEMGGNVAFSGNRDIGYEALITRAQRLSNILGCGNITPHPNAGLSGSYFLPSRNGEGIVVQWLPDGNVLVIFFTYDLNGEQQWVLGIGASDGFSVTMDALYASTNTRWGSDYDKDEVDLTSWGTFELVWTECGGVQFTYNSTVPGYGSATRQYTRLTSLWEASCPGF